MADRTRVLNGNGAPPSSTAASHGGQTDLDDRYFRVQLVPADFCGPARRNVHVYRTIDRPLAQYARGTKTTQTKNLVSSRKLTQFFVLDPFGSIGGACARAGQTLGRIGRLRNELGQNHKQNPITKLQKQIAKHAHGQNFKKLKKNN